MGPNGVQTVAMMARSIGRQPFMAGKWAKEEKRVRLRNFEGREVRLLQQLSQKSRLFNGMVEGQGDAIGWRLPLPDEQDEYRDVYISDMDRIFGSLIQLASYVSMIDGARD